jgi:hypothetical protein
LLGDRSKIHDNGFAAVYRGIAMNESDENVWAIGEKDRSTAHSEPHPARKK